MLFLKLAWRNIWRNKRRTFITMFIIMIAVVLSIYMRSQQEGSYAHMINNTAGTFVGHIQIHQLGYWEEQNLDNSLAQEEKLVQEIKKIPGVENIVPRLESYALLAGLEKSRAGLIVGIDPKAELALSNPKKRIIEGTYLESIQEDGALVAEGLAKFLDLKVGDTLVAIGQGYQGMSAVGQYPIKAIFKFPTPTLNKSLVYLPLNQAQDFFAAYDRLTAYSLIVKNPKLVQPITQSLHNQLDTETYEVMSWPEMIPEIEQLIVADKVGGFIVIAILYMVVGFGIFGTIIMMTTERRYEFGILISIGMRRWKLSLVVLLETLMLAALSVVVGSLLIEPLIWYLYQNPIRLTGDMARATEEMGLEPLMVFSNDFSLFASQGLIVFILTFLVSLYPIWVIKRIRVVEATRR